MGKVRCSKPGCSAKGTVKMVASRDSRSSLMVCQQHVVWGFQLVNNGQSALEAVVQAHTKLEKEKGALHGTNERRAARPTARRGSKRLVQGSQSDL